MQTDEPLFKKMLAATAPLLLWAGHFVFLYVFVAVACIAGVARLKVAGFPVATVVLLLESVAVMIAAVILLLRAAGLLRRSGSQAGMVEVVRAGSALLATLAIAWASLPVLVLRTCN